MMSYVLHVYTYNFVVGLSQWNIAYEYTYNTVGDRTVALNIIARCSITQTPTGQSKVWWLHARKMVVI